MSHPPQGGLSFPQNPSVVRVLGVQSGKVKGDSPPRERLRRSLSNEIGSVASSPPSPLKVASLRSPPIPPLGNVRSWTTKVRCDWSKSLFVSPHHTLPYGQNSR
eukprot:TRINITY_DN2661_c0_g3_i2.p3 TRINITY_DN2661_c0_g3~~TRINITY_DN2661_c0_g3_i2.p3  ORF type:complete len:104 (+),score=21.45 TRINITY_DN2661_c0_g3_i2:395-706(+)